MLNNFFKQYSQEFQGIGEAGPVSYTTGLYYYRERGNVVNQQQFFGQANTTDSIYDYGTDAYAAYGQVDYHATDAITLTGGVRYSAEHKIMNASLARFIRPPEPSPRFIRKLTAVRPAMPLRPPPSSSTPSRPMRMSTSSTRADSRVAASVSTPRRPSHCRPTSRNSWTATNSARSCASSTARYSSMPRPTTIKVKDLQLSVAHISGILTVTIVDNAASATIKGFELEAQWAPIDRCD